ncbi:hypothetical protein CHLNCDRAFT_136234 [Chlorella variabilis]|uniref:Fibronectin type-III domain-containing protein n=1 Tax=Chlorella variabilis TaxID=554065 RepID=E1ZJ98_CHLVA|nr:hypothetical protein CHLNCDRAFT_136234 [Chlorella variabilis]EFN54099.1 hypothetical protein CHLNCDRAFT_136234 [Chlorella variabilis]|eukprot:XP_005846201.1 hypothetical protein CHLNCDRAFT_136234 [Chlorella variabilis]
MFLPSSKTSHDLLNPFRALSNCSVPGAPTIDGVAAEAGGDLRIAVLPPATDGGSSITAYFILGLPTNGGPILAAGGSLGQPAVDDAAATKTWGWLALGSSSSSSSSNPTTGRRASLFTLPAGSWQPGRTYRFLSWGVNSAGRGPDSAPFEFTTPHSECGALLSTVQSQLRR